MGDAAGVVGGADGAASGGGGAGAGDEDGEGGGAGETGGAVDESERSSAEESEGGLRLVTVGTRSMERMWAQTPAQLQIGEVEGAARATGPAGELSSLPPVSASCFVS
mmetsp:Transcript_23082/g.45620  ORF Transcript_23082/g.45620 Transcript_23082/m.45620 type:complete len:108 (-) Transcript_23082:250-573(-)